MNFTRGHPMLSAIRIMRATRWTAMSVWISRATTLKYLLGWCARKATRMVCRQRCGNPLGGGGIRDAKYFLFRLSNPQKLTCIIFENLFGPYFLPHQSHGYGYCPVRLPSAARCKRPPDVWPYFSIPAPGTNKDEALAGPALSVFRTVPTLSTLEPALWLVCQR